ncbi:hypothetical protein ANME2D_00815 [Candidatus Methanoperedens nitroreducens]|uniref:EF-hand domain-containing protein n=1 Tax=Candidatus Methanoperedens nitratireducens TaxID=1392998 RepID=A0A062V753_9EURY|nr:hypothetical protein [Candidatus Methanoperedens nitroreducens]KCZ72388.1 hypothetical protein ANME2D_00815 [Candidatus Methanoperedens nitroreducens]MDJ1423678.1 hypothetical protein [Candidatus Methanoperedens sp.]
MNRKISVILLITIVSLIGVPQAQANKIILNDFTTLYNASDTKLNTCKTCMASTTPPVSWNKYGLDLRSNTAFNRSNSIQAMKNIEPLDSDGDKFINIDEIHNSTFPGDESDFPIISTSSVTPSSTVTPIQTQIQTPTITPIETEPKSTNTIMNGFFTLVMFAFVYFSAIRKRKE